MSQIVDALRTRAPGLEVRLASVELVEPDVPTVLAEIPADRRAVLLPLLLSSGYHNRVDLPAAIAATRPGTAHAAVLGPDPLLAVALADRLDEAGARAGDAVVLAAAGSSDPDAVASVHTQAGLLARELTRRWGVGTAVAAGFGSAASPTVAEAVAGARGAGRVAMAGARGAGQVAVAGARWAGRVAISPYLLAPGYFADRLSEAGADLVAAPLAAHPAVVELILQRATEASIRD